jgi:NAD(P)H dehydrogenase (quinone)
MILITGAGGKTGKAVIRRLVKRGAKIRALVHHVNQQAELIAMGLNDVVCGDMRQRAYLFKAAEGADAIYHICPNMSPDEYKIGRLVLDAARSNGVQHFIYHSVLHPHARQMPHHWNKLRVETAIFASGLNFTILQPTAYMQNILTYWPRIVSEGVYSLPYAAETRLGLVDLEDVAEAAAKLILEPSFKNGIYELVGTPSYSQTEIAQRIGGKLGKTVQVETLSRADWEENALRNGMSEYAIHTLLKMFIYYENYGMGGNSSVLEWILGRPPVTFGQFLDRILVH